MINLFNTEYRETAIKVYEHSVSVIMNGMMDRLDRIELFIPNSVCYDVQRLIEKEINQSREIQFQVLTPDAKTSLVRHSIQHDLSVRKFVIKILYN